VLLFATTALRAQVPAPGLVLTPPVLVSEPRLGTATAGDLVLGVAPQGDGFRVWYSRKTDGGTIHVVDVAANGQTEIATHRVVFEPSANVQDFTVLSAGGRTSLFWLASDGNELRFSPATADGLAEVPAGIAITRAGVMDLGCNAERCL